MNLLQQFGCIGVSTAIGLALVWGTTSLPAAEGKPAKPAKTNTVAKSSEDLFAKAEVHQLRIDLSDSAREGLRQDPHHYVKATVQEGSRIYTDVGLRLKGGTNAPGIDKKPGWVLTQPGFAA